MSETKKITSDSLVDATDEDGVVHDLFCLENLEFLEVAKDLYSETVDFCYIDPPYNTGGNPSFLYKDSFHQKGDPDRHQSWLAFMKPRLQGLIPLLKGTGVVAISIDDSEVHRLRMVCDELFGENNFVAQVIVDGGAMKNNAKLVSTTHEYLLIYAKNHTKLLRSEAKWRTERDGIKVLRKKELALRKKHKKDYAAMATELKDWMKTSKLSKRLRVFYNVDESGLYTYADLSTPNSKKFYDYPHPITGKPVQVPSRGWGPTYEKLQEMEKAGEVLFFENETYQPMKKLYLKNGRDQAVRSILSYPSRTSTHLLESMLGRRSSFNNPKNLDYISYLVDVMSPEENGVVLDYFAGSGTTGHAVADLNAKGASRKFILCTNNENNIYDEVTKPRLVAAITGEWGNGTSHKNAGNGLQEHKVVSQ